MQIKNFPVHMYNLSIQCDFKSETGLPLIIKLKIPYLFPDFSLTFYSFPYPLIDQKIIFILLFNSANCITSNLGLLLKDRKFFPLSVAPNEGGDGLSFKKGGGGDGLRLSHEKVHLFPS